MIHTTTNLPSKIYLVLSPDGIKDAPNDFTDYDPEEIKWSTERVNESDIEYSLPELVQQGIIAQKAKKYAERVCNGKFPIQYTREQVVKHTISDFIAGANAVFSTPPTKQSQPIDSIQQAIHAVENFAADVLLSEASVLLQQARYKVAQYLETNEIEAQGEKGDAYEELYEYLCSVNGHTSIHFPFSTIESKFTIARKS